VAGSIIFWDCCTTSWAASDKPTMVTPTAVIAAPRGGATMDTIAPRKMAKMPRASPAWAVSPTAFSRLGISWTFCHDSTARSTAVTTAAAFDRPSSALTPKAVAF
jgi:hypothetical protein